MSSEAYENENDPAPLGKRTLDDLIDSLERLVGAFTQSAISPDEQQEYERFELLQGGPTTLDMSISFIAREVRVDNFSNVHVEITNALVGQMWAPPKVVGFRIPLSGTRHIKARFAAPPGTTDPGQNTNSMAVLIFSKFPTSSVVVLDGGIT